MEYIRCVYTVCVTMIYILICVSAGIERQSEEERLLGYLFRHYNPSARPVINSTKTVNVKLTFSLMHIQELDVKSQILTSTGLLILDWTDERLMWHLEDFNLTEVVIEANKLWVPEFAVINGAEEIYGDYKDFRAIITYDGQVHWEPGGVFKTMCSIDITYFPFDDQKCNLVFGAWSYHTTKMNLTNSSHEINLDSYEKNGEWEIVKTIGLRDEFSYAGSPNEKFSFVSYTLNIRRRYTFYVMNVILPSMVTSVLLLSIFYCPPGQKVQIGVVVLLSFRIFLLNVTDSIPKTSDHIPLLGIYLTCTMAITTLSMVLTVLVLNLNSISERPVPRCIRIVVLDYLARLFCKCDDHTNHKSEGIKKTLINTNPYPRAPSDEDSELEQVPIISLNGNVNSNGGGHETTSFVFMPNSTMDRSNYFRRELPHSESHKKPDYSKDWQRLAEVVDRMFFWTFLLAIIGISLLLFHPLTKRSMAEDDST